jgi:uncharacterized membrane protein
MSQLYGLHQLQRDCDLRVSRLLSFEHCVLSSGASPTVTETQNPKPKTQNAKLESAEDPPLAEEFRKQSKQRDNPNMSTLVVVGYDDPYKAEEVRLKLRKLQSEYLLDLEDAVVVVKDENGKIKLHQAVNLTAAGAVSGGFWGSLIGLIFLNPLVGMAVGAAAGAASGALTDVGVNDNFMKELASTMTPGSSTLFVLVRKATPDKVLEELKGTGGKILKTSLSHEDEAKLQAALSGTA